MNTNKIFVADNKLESDNKLVLSYI